MKLPVPRSLTETVAPILLINWMVGVGVFEYPIGRPRRIASIIRSFVILSIYLGLVGLTTYLESSFTTSKVAAFNYLLNSYLSAILIATCMSLAYVRQKVEKDIFTKINHINGRLNILGIPNDYELLFKTQMIQLLVALIWISVTIILGFEYLTRKFTNELSRTSFSMYTGYLLVFASAVNFRLSIIIRYFGNRFRRLNSIFMRLDRSERSGITVSEMSHEQLPWYPSVIHEILRNNSTAIRGTDQRWHLYVLRETREIHRGLCKMAKDLNRAFGIQILFSVTLSFGFIISFLYTTYVQAIVSKKNMLHRSIVVIAILMWLMVFIMKVFVIVEACDTASYEANRTGRIISTSLETAAFDEDIRAEIKMFSLQLIQNRLEFTASGYFTLNYSMLGSMIGSVTTYLVIVIQMRAIYEPNDVSSGAEFAVIMHTNDTVI